MDFDRMKIYLSRIQLQTSIEELELMLENQNEPHIFRLMIQSKKFINADSMDLLKTALSKCASGSKISLEFAKILLYNNKYPDLNELFRSSPQPTRKLFFLNKDFTPDENSVIKIIEDDNVEIFSFALKRKKICPEMLVGEKSLLMCVIDLKCTEIMKFILSLKNFNPHIDFLRNYCEASENLYMLQVVEKFS